MSQITITLSDGTPSVTVFGEPFGSHLAVTPGMHMDRTTATAMRYDGGYWAVTHVPTGRAVVFATSLDLARTAAERLAASGIDWDRPLADLQADTAARDVVDAVRASVLGLSAVPRC
ncbi:hypothetical protein ACPPVO_47100 [Dactylosporangium sp. McL0621]|uniref:hypothetical protein n=1 Tax=Dactylosporangium sp. McL0621 TaxID=3415678 RepID=UPI003CE7D6F8